MDKLAKLAPFVKLALSIGLNTLPPLIAVPLREALEQIDLEAGRQNLTRDQFIDGLILKFPAQQSKLDDLQAEIDAARQRNS